MSIIEQRDCLVFLSRIVLYGRIVPDNISTLILTWPSSPGPTLPQMGANGSGHGTLSFEVFVTRCLAWAGFLIPRVGMLLCRRKKEKKKEKKG